MVIILMGVSGSGKTTVGRELAARLGWEFHDADDFHPPQNVAKMRSGTPLTEGDRAPWVKSLTTLIRSAIDDHRSIILACSALSRGARQALRVDDEHVRFVHLKGSMELIRRRLESRKGHYMPPGLLQSQFAALQDPAGEALEVDIDATPQTIVDEIRRGLGL